MHDPKQSSVRPGNPLIREVQGAHTALSLEVSEWRALLVSLRTPAGWRKAGRAALPLLAYAVAWIISLHVTTVLALVLNPRIEGQDPLYIRGAVTVSALLLTRPRRWWLYLLVTLPLVPLECWFLGLPNTAAVRELIFFVCVIIVCISVVTVSLIRRYLPLPLRFASVGEVSRFTICVAVGAVPAILIAASARAVVFSWNFWLSWQIGYLGYVLGIVIFTPAIVLWLTEGPRGLGLTSRRQQVEGGLLLLTTVVASVVVFGTQLPDKLLADALLFTLVPVLIWAAVRFGPQGLASTLALVTILAITGTVFNRGPFVGGSAINDTVALQLSLLFVGMPLFFLAAVVQDRKQAGVELQASEARYRGVVESQTELISRYLPDTTLTFVNEANCRSMGLSREQLLGTKFIDVLPESEREPVRARIRSLLAHPGEPGVSTMEHQTRMADGSLRWQQWVNRTILDDTGHVIELQGVGRDITERKQMEHQLHASEARYRATFDSAAIGVAIVDLAGHPLEVNAYVCRMLGYTGDELCTMVLGDFTHPDDVAENQALMRRARDGETGSYQFEKRYLHKDGHVVWGRVSSSLVRGQDGNPAYFVTHLEDITPRKQLEGERAEAHARELAAQQVAEQLEAFLAVAAHDIRSPVTVVSSQVQLARRRAGRLVEAFAASPQADSLTAPLVTQAVDAVVESLVAAEAGVERMRRLVAQLFDVVRARSEMLAVELAPCDLTALVQKNVAAQQASVPQRRIELEAPETMVLVDADADRLDQVMSNYLTNALKYSPAEQPVTVKLEVVEHQAVVSVADHGPGLPRKEQSGIWELFHRVPGIEVQSESGQASGSLGLGLYICKHLVELHPGGSVGVESVVGEGSTFWFRLPLVS